MGYAKYVGRVGALAVALGVSGVVTLPPHVAWATPESEASDNTASESTNTPVGNAPADPGTAASETISSIPDPSEAVQVEGHESVGSGPTSTIGSDSTGMQYSSSGGAITSGEGGADDDANRADPPAAGVVPSVEAPPVVQVPVSNPDPAPAAAPAPVPAPTPAPAPELKPLNGSGVPPKLPSSSGPAQISASPVDRNAPASRSSLLETETPNTLSPTPSPTADTFSLAGTLSAAGSAPQPQPQPQSGLVSPLAPVAGFITGVLSFIGLNPLVTGAPAAPAPPPPTLWAVLAWARREFEKAFLNQAPTLGYDSDLNSQDREGVVTGDLEGDDIDGDPITYAVTQIPGKGTVVVAPDGTFTYTPSDALAETGGEDTFKVIATSAGTGMHLQDVVSSLARLDLFGALAALTTPPRHEQTITVYVTKVNTAPTVDPENATTPLPNLPGDPPGTVRGQVNVVDEQDDPLTYTGPATTPKGTLTVNADGTFVYHANEAAQHAASADDADEDDVYDTFTITADDGRGGTVQVPVRVAIAEFNTAAPGGTITPNAGVGSDGTVSGTVRISDPQGDTVKYSGTATSTKGTLTVNEDGTYSYTPNPDARHAASTTGASSDVTTDTFTVTGYDGHGGTTTVSLTLTIAPSNTYAQTGTVTPQPGFGTNGEVTGTVNVVDPQGDTMTYSVLSNTGKSLSISIDPVTGAYTYTPSAAARHNAAADNAGTAATTDSFTVVADDGHGGVTYVTVNVDIASANNEPVVNATPTVNPPSAAGVVTGTVAATDADNDTLTYRITTGPTRGTVTMTGATFTYTPTGAAQLAAYNSSEPVTDSFTITVSDGHGGTKTVVVESIPVTPAPAAVLASHSVPGGGSSSHPGLTAGPDGTVYSSTRDGNSIFITAISPSGNKTTYTVAETGQPVGPIAVGGDGKLYQTVAGNDRTAVVAVDPATGQYRYVASGLTGSPNSGVMVGPDGTIHQYTMQYDSTELQYRYVLHVIDPVTRVSTPVAVDGTPTETQFAPDGTVVVASFVSDTFRGEDGSTHSMSVASVLTVIDPADPAAKTTYEMQPGFSMRPAIDEHSTAYLVFYEDYNPKLLVVNHAAGVSRVLTLPNGTGTELEIGSEGEVYVTRNGAVLEVDPVTGATTTVATLPSDYTRLSAGPDGTVYAYGFSSSTSTLTLTAVRVGPTVSSPVSATVYPSQQVSGYGYATYPPIGADGTVYQQLGAYDERWLLAVNPNTGAHSILPITNYPLIAAATDGTGYVITGTGSMTVLDSATGTVNEVPLGGTPVGSPVAGSDGTVFQMVSTSSGTKVLQIRHA